jgi:hypothetical protein
MHIPTVAKVVLSFGAVPYASIKAKSKSMQAGTPAVPGEAISIYEALSPLRRTVTYRLLKEKVKTSGVRGCPDVLMGDDDFMPRLHDSPPSGKRSSCS